MGNINKSYAAANAEANALGPLLNSGTLNIYAGTQPANANTALSGQTLLATLTFGATAFGAAVNGVITANAITGATAIATGTATFARLLASDASTVLDTNVATSGAGLNLANIAIVDGNAVSITNFTLTISTVS